MSDTSERPSYSTSLRSWFPRLQPVISDLWRLEAFQIEYLLERLPERDLGTLLAHRAELAAFFVRRCPASRPTIDRLVGGSGSASAAGADSLHATLIAPPWSYRCEDYVRGGDLRRRYWRVHSHDRSR